MNYKVFKRPMFRYGGPSWQGTGITAGLDTPPRIDLAEGGRTIGGGTIHGTPMGNRTGFATPYVEGWNRIFGNPTKTILSIITFDKAKFDSNASEPPRKINAFPVLMHNTDKIY